MEAVVAGFAVDVAAALVPDLAAVAGWAAFVAVLPEATALFEGLAAAWVEVIG